MSTLDFRHLAELHRRALHNEVRMLIIGGILALLAGLVVGFCIVGVIKL